MQTHNDLLAAFDREMEDSDLLHVSFDEVMMKARENIGYSGSKLTESQAAVLREQFAAAQTEANLGWGMKEREEP